MNKFAQKVKALRDKKGYTAAELSRLLGKSKNTVYGYEKYGSKPALEDLLKLCELLDTTPNDLIWDYPTVYKQEEEYVRELNEAKEIYGSQIKIIHEKGLNDEADMISKAYDKVVSENIMLKREVDKLKKELAIYKEAIESIEKLKGL